MVAGNRAKREHLFIDEKWQTSVSRVIPYCSTAHNF
jgi:hypothetical protein